MKKLILLTLAWVLSSGWVIAQSIPLHPNHTDAKGQKQGLWTYLYDSDWQPVNDTSQTAYYRVLTYQDGKPTGKVIDYYRSGQVQMVADSVISEDPSTYQGKVIRYRADGSRKGLHHYEQGKVVEEVFYNRDGTVAEENWQSLNQKGMKAYESGDYPNAQVYLEKAKIQAEKEFGQEHANYALSCHNLAISYETQGLYVQAEPLYREATDTYARVLGKQHPMYAFCLNSLAVVYQKQGLYTKAEPLYREAKDIYAKTMGQEHPNYANSLNNLAALYLRQGQPAQAEPLLLEAKNIYEKANGKDHIDFARACNNLAYLYSEQSRYAQAEPLYRKAKDIYAKALGTDHPDYATSCHNLAKLYQRQGQYAQAESLYQEAKSIEEKVLSQNNLNYEQSCRDLADLYDEQGQYDRAEPLYRKSSQILIWQTETNFSHLSQEEKGQFFNTFKSNFESYNSFTLRAYQQIPSLTAWLYDLRLATKGLLFQSSQKTRRRILASGDSTLIAQFQTWQNQREYLAYVYTLTQAEKEQEGIRQDSLEAAANALEKELSRKSQLFAQATDTTRYSWRDVQSKLKPGQAALEIIRTRYKNQEWTDSVLYLALLVKPDTKDQPELIVLPHGNDLEGKYLAAYRNRIQAQSADPLSYRQYWQTIAKALEGTQQVYLSADGVYHQINLSTLQNPETGKYLLEEIDVQLLSSTRQVTQPPGSIGQTQNALLLGRPVYDLETHQHQQASQDYQTERGTDREGQVAGSYTISEEMARTNFAELPGTEGEVRQIHEELQARNWRSELYVGENALEEVIKAAPSPRVLHIATHGLFFAAPRTDQEQPFQSPLALNPMLRSGLALTGVNSYAQNTGAYSAQVEDGLLTAYEAMNLDLDSTELVVLSACETGKGEVQNGEGVYGLQRGFQQAGAKAVLMSLWKVDDEATQKLMSRFYAYWIGKGLSKRLAFAQAQLSLKKAYPHPYYWGAFVLVGE